MTKTPEKFALTLLLLLALLPLLAGQDTTTEKDLRFFVLPVVYYTPETSWAFGGATVFTFTLGEQDSLTKPSQLQFGAAYTLRDQFLVYLPFQLIFPRDQYRLFGEVGYYKYNYFFYGIGNGYENYEGEIYDVNFPRVRLNFQRKLAPHFYGGVRYWLDDFNITGFEEGGILANQDIPGKQGNVLSAGGLIFTYDNRDQLYYTRKGQFIELGWLANTELLGANYTFDKFTLDARQFFPLGEKAALGINAYAELTFGDPAFNQLALLGGPKRLRGYLEGRYRDNHYLMLQTEYRFPLFWRLGGVAFGGFGAVADQLDHFDGNAWRYALGLGLRLTLIPEDNINLRLDYGFGPDSSGFYFTIGEAFQRLFKIINPFDMKVSIIIPTLNEAENIARLVKRLFEYGGAHAHEVIVVDGGSTDETCELAKAKGARVLQSPKGRAIQMNYGVDHSTGDILYFVHGDTLPPTTYMEDIFEALKEGYVSGIFRFKFDSDRWILRVNSWFTRFDQLWCRGGDQSIFVTRSAFEDLGGYDKDHIIMEEYDFMIRLRKKYPFKIIQKDTLVSARKYDNNSYLRVQVANFIVFNMYRLGYAQEKIIRTYCRLLNYRYDRETQEEKEKVGVS